MQKTDPKQAIKWFESLSIPDQSPTEAGPNVWNQRI